MSVTKTVVARIHCCRDGGDERAGGRATAAATFMYDGLAIMSIQQAHAQYPRYYAGVGTDRTYVYKACMTNMGLRP